MPVSMRYLGWSAFEVTVEDGRRFILDPVLAGVPAQKVPPSPARIEEFDGVDYILVTHAAQDHIGEAFDILGRGHARLICDVVTRILAENAGIPSERIVSMIPGVQFAFDGLLVKALPAEHLSFRKVNETTYLSGPPLSYLVTSLEGVRIFFGGDTSISANHQLFGQLYKPHLAVLGVGGVDQQGQSVTELYPHEAALVAKWLGVKAAFPIHYRLDEADLFVKALKKTAPRVKPILLQPGESYTFQHKKTTAKTTKSRQRQR